MLQLYFLYPFQRPHAAGTEFHTAGRGNQEGLSVYDNRQGSRDVSQPPSMSKYRQAHHTAYTHFLHLVNLSSPF